MPSGMPEALGWERL